MATLLSVGAESALLCLLQSHPFQPARGHMGQRTHGTGAAPPLAAPAVLAGDHPQPPQQPAQGFPLLHKTRHESQLFTLPLTYTLLSAELWVSFAPWLDGNCLIQLSFTWGLHYFQKLSPASHTNQRNYCCSIMFLHCHSWETKQALLYLLLYSRPGDCLRLFWFKKVSGNFQFFLFSSRR